MNPRGLLFRASSALALCAFVGVQAVAAERPSPRQPDIAALEAAVDPSTGSALRQAVFKEGPKAYRQYGPPGPYWPERAEREGVSGGAVLECAMATSGKLSNCKAAFETPVDFGFGFAALAMAKQGFLTAAPDPSIPDGTTGRILVAFKNPHLH